MVDLSTHTFISHTHHKKALFLDRDGVVIEYVPYLSKPEQVKLPDGAGEALKQWQEAGYLLILITNQAGIGRGYFTLEDVEKVHTHIRQQYQPFGVHFHDIFLCPHHPEENCSCRKPSPGMLISASKRHHISMCESFFIGDAPSDLECAMEAECEPILVLTGRGKSTVKQIAQYSHNIKVFKNLLGTVELIKSNKIKVNL